jgi:hypothetical protein
MIVIDYKKRRLELEWNSFILFRKQKFDVKSRTIYIINFFWISIFYTKLK